MNYRSPISFLPGGEPSLVKNVHQSSFNLNIFAENRGTSHLHSVSSKTENSINRNVKLILLHASLIVEQMDLLAIFQRSTPVNVNKHPTLPKIVGAQNAVVILEENGRIGSDLGMQMSKTRGCSYLGLTVPLRRKSPHCNFRVRVCVRVFFRLGLGLLFMSFWGEQLGGHFMTFILRISCQKWWWSLRERQGDTLCFLWQSPYV